ncbi:hypothetical protein [Anaeromyxobacter sp. Fw109-5]|uniref:hypothetical protein n=1 Tax=Anaeromyxobacter sp. (strain Fw109-5) TaxID=404589 RepID=UPI0000ED7D96|nr:hypothetical protein [Anaeromyxobacter sp. Fw109-5]ABS25802.1 hypothetical protein Anae109_1598 [Anaeromyxobacter sp. Fw109-5]
MFATTIRFALPEGTDWERLRQLAIRRTFEIYRFVPGLRSMAFVYSPEQSELGGNFVWETQDHAEAFLRSEAWRTAVSLYGEPQVERAEVCAYVEDGDLVFPPDYDARPSPYGQEAPSPPPAG